MIPFYFRNGEPNNRKTLIKFMAICFIRKFILSLVLIFLQGRKQLFLVSGGVAPTNHVVALFGEGRYSRNCLLRSCALTCVAQRKVCPFVWVLMLSMGCRIHSIPLSLRADSMLT